MQPAADADTATIYAYEIHDPVGMAVVPAPIDRDWMDAAHQRHPYRCLPLVIANQAGWVVECPADFRCYWYGGPSVADVQVEFHGRGDSRITSHFGSGVVTFSLPYIFRTPPGINLWIKGPANYIRDGVQALEGVVETDWNPATFTMNWKITRPNVWHEFRRGDPICMLVPIPRGLAESMQPYQLPLTENPELREKYAQWEQSRTGFLRGLKDKDPDALKQGWQKDYFQGRRPEGGKFEQHQTNLQIKPFTPPPRGE